MTKEVKYTCDLCENLIGSEEVIGIEWNGATGEIFQVQSDRADHHLCVDCIRDVKRLSPEKL